MKKTLIYTVIISLLVAVLVGAGYWFLNQREPPYAAGGIIKTKSLIRNIQAGV